ncbi:helix-turn-helix domain-containing protein [Marinactinospora thermotolerans]|uniref:Helix-turn-helix domain-containing protein n=1 Tax=Marinactinospora thermotolerans DSM 45154 TaxID=1122192 RepID=A0A1T4TH22_9ACTN|nr:helix-turn-helix transcriptional regulator [Marinactinospora thermotolerans]SKA39529.1 Helix-turn-helix domain-containing protein [Marinactinospora thermotolerans DSM 45154]
MPSPTLRRRRLSRLLYALREERGLTAKAVAAQAKERSGRVRGWSESKLNRLESGEWKRAKVDDIATLLDIYGITDPAEREAYFVLAREAGQQGWWASYGDALGSGQFVGLETEARSIRTCEMMAIPGLLQTEDYARAIIQASTAAVGDPLDERDLDRRVEARMLRKSILLGRNDPPTYWAVIGEAALLHITPCLKGQLKYLLEMGERANIGIQVLPVSRGPHAAMTGQFVILDFLAPDPPVVYLEALSEEIYLETPDEIRRYQQIYSHVQAEALPVGDSRAFIRSRLSELQ